MCTRSPVYPVLRRTLWDWSWKQIISDLRPPDVGLVDEVEFTLEETTELMVYVSVYDGCDCDVVATPVIYKEG